MCWVSYREHVGCVALLLLTSQLQTTVAPDSRSLPVFFVRMWIVCGKQVLLHSSQITMKWYVPNNATWSVSNNKFHVVMTTSSTGKTTYLGDRSSLSEKSLSSFNNSCMISLSLSLSLSLSHTHTVSLFLFMFFYLALSFCSYTNGQVVFC